MIILKILLWILLGSLALALLLLGLVLFVPLRYSLRAEGGTASVSDEGEEALPAAPFRAQAEAGWLLKSVRFIAGYDQKLSYRFTLFGKELMAGPAAKEKAWPEPAAGQAAASDEKTVDEADREAKQEPTEKAEETPQNEKKKSKAEKKKTKKPKKEKDGEDIRDKADRLMEKAEELVERIRYYLDLLADNAEGIRLVLAALWKLLKKLLPDACDIYACYGFSDPSLTGESAGAWAMIEPALVTDKRKIVLEQDYERQTLSADGWMKGGFAPAALLGVLLGALFHKPVRKLIRTLIRLIKEEKNKPQEAEANG